jgi:ATP synthase F1 delta subunit
LPGIRLHPAQGRTNLSEAPLVEEIAEVYARSLFQVANEQGKLDEIREQLGQFAGALEQDHDLQVFFFSPYFSTQEKQEGLDRAVTGADPILVNFLKLLIENHRMPVLFRVRRAYESMWEEENRLLPVSITSAVELDEATVRQIGDRISEQTGRRVDLSANVEPDILGGIVVRVGNAVLDASVRNRLEQLRKQVVRV